MIFKKSNGLKFPVWIKPAWKPEIWDNFLPLTPVEQISILVELSKTIPFDAKELKKAARRLKKYHA